MVTRRPAPAQAALRTPGWISRTGLFPVPRRRGPVPDRRRRLALRKQGWSRAVVPQSRRRRARTV